MRRSLYEPDHEAFRLAFRDFLHKEVVPHMRLWEDERGAPRELFLAAGDAGYLGMDAPEHLGGGGVRDFRFQAVAGEELAAAGAGGVGLGLTLHNDVVMPYLLDLADADQQARWLPGLTSGRTVAAVAMTEPGTGSDLAAIRTTARRDGDHYIVDGAKTFISNGINADLVVTAVKTDPGARHTGVSLLVLERGMEGFERGRRLDKIGLHGQDTAEMSFTEVRVPVRNLLGPREGEGFAQLMRQLPRERLSLAVAALAATRAALTVTLEHVRHREAFGRPIGSFQNSRFALAEIDTELDLATSYVDDCVRALNANDLTPVDAAKAKWWCTELQGRAVDRCLQLHGGYGYMSEYSIARAYLDARVTRIYGGTTEIMKEVIGRALGL